MIQSPPGEQSGGLDWDGRGLKEVGPLRIPVSGAENPISGDTLTKHP